MTKYDLIAKLKRLPGNPEISYAGENGYTLPVNEVREAKTKGMCDYFLVGMINGKVRNMIK